MTEHTEQVSLFQKAEQWEADYPELALLFAIPMGGKRHPRVGQKLKESGAKKGVLDICLPVARHGYHGLYLELKVKGRYPSKEQKWWIEKLREQGYRVEVCYSCDAAWDVVIDYLTGGDE